MAVIQQLDAHLTNMIAAGEVVERPMGVIKELIENSLDAKATRVEVNIEQGGTVLMEVIDNGIGMDKEDACLCFERHATSKIRTTEDLWAIHTLGFRGEALPSIASVSNLTLLTNNGEDSTRVEIRYGQRQSARPYPCNRGTQITVSGLFHKTPARLKHLKSIPYETSLVLDVVQKFALSYPNVAFRLVHDGKEAFRSSGNGNLLEVMALIYGRDLARQCIEVKGQDYDYQIHGFMALPSQTRASRYYMTVFINQRMIRSYRIQKAIVDSYKDFIPQDRYPIAVLNITMDSHLCDVNVHPSKWEIRLSKEQQLEYLIRDCMRKALREHMQAPEMQREPSVRTRVEIPQLFDTSVHPAQQVREETVITRQWKNNIQNVSGQKERTAVGYPQPVRPQAQPTVNYPHPVRQSTPVQGSQPVSQIPVQMEITREMEEPAVITEPLQPVQKKKFPQMQVLAQMHGKYILAQDENNLYIIDQHAAQERVHFEEVTKKFLEQDPVMQDLLVPIIMDGRTSVINQLSEVNEILSPMGVSLEAFGSDSLICRQLPTWMSEIDAQAFLQDVLDLWKDGKEVKAEDLERHRLATFACHHSIRFNRVLSVAEMQEVIDQLAACEQPFHCPHGRPTFITITDKELIREFQR